MSCSLRRCLLAVLLACGAFVVASCDGSGANDKENVQDLLDRAFRSEIRSADLKIDAQLQIKGGSQSMDKPLNIRATGPFSGNEGKLPSIDLALELGNGGGQTVQTGFLSTGDRAFVKFQDVYYEQPASAVREANKSLARNQGNRSSLSSLGLDPRSWLADAREEDDEQIAGVAVKHVSGTLDMTAVMSDLNEFVKRSSGAINGATGEDPPQPLTSTDIEKVTKVVKNPTFDVYVGKDDEVIRRVSGRIEVTVPKRDRAAVGGMESGTLEFSVEFRKVNLAQKVVAPARARPLEELTRSLGASGLGELGGLAGGGGDGDGDGDGQSTTPQTPDSTTPQDTEAFKAYSDCLERAKPDDTDALQRCALLLAPSGATP